MRFNVEVAGRELLSREITELMKEVPEAAMDGLNMVGLLVAGEAKKSIQEHRSVGRTYVVRGIEHEASAPGNPPNSQTGTLVQSIQSESDESEMSVYIGTNLDYGAHLEFGTDKMAARPWLLPAVQAKSKDIVNIIEAIVRKALE